MASYKDFLPAVQSGGGWQRPSDWLALPTVTSAEQKFVGLHAVFPDGDNVCALLLTTSAGQYEVDWGDGTVTLHNSNTKAEHQYDYSTISASTDCSRGYRQVLVTVTPVSGNILTINFQQRYTGRNQIYATGWLDVIGSFPNASSGGSLIFGGFTVSQAFVEQVTWVTIGGVTSCNSMFRLCTSLQSIPVFNTASVTNMIEMFHTCSNLMDVPLLNTGNVTDMTFMFNNCYSLQTIPLLNTGNVTDMAIMFGYCHSLITVPLLNTANVTRMLRMFEYCYSLESVPLFNTVKATNMDQMFYSCSNLKNIPTFNTAVVTTFSQMFTSCFSLINIPALSTAAVTPSAGEDFATFFAVNNYSLARCEMVFARNVGFQNSGLSRTAIVEIFNNLADRTATTSATISLSGNFGVASLTAGDLLIATSKNWVVAT